MVDQKINVDIVTENYLTGFAPIYSVLQNQSIQIINRTSVHTICYLFKFNNYSTPIPKHQRVHLAQTKSTTDHKPIELSNIMSSPSPIPKSPIQSSPGQVQDQNLKSCDMLHGPFLSSLGFRMHYKYFKS